MPTSREIWDLCCTIVGSDEQEFDPEASVYDLGFDEESLSALVAHLEAVYGDGTISFDDVVVANPTMNQLASYLPVASASLASLIKLFDATPPPPPSPTPPPPSPKPPSPSSLARSWSTPPLYVADAGGKALSTTALSAVSEMTTEGNSPSSPSADLPAVRPTLSYNENLGVGVIGGCIETALLMPVLTWKFCVQEGRPYPRFPSWAWYRGVSVLAGSVAPLTGIQMFCNGVLESVMTKGQRNPTDGEMIGCALGAGAVSAVLYAPVELTTIHQQKTGLGPLGTISHLTNKYGITSLWRGLLPTAWREAIYTAGYLGLGPLFSAKIMQQPGWEDRFLLSGLFGSCAAGVLANVASHPIDTAKTVIQADVTGKHYGGMMSTLSTLFRSSGMARLYTGGLARTIRTCGAFFVVSTMREQLIQYKASQRSFRA